jgi:CcmD family protein
MDTLDYLFWAYNVVWIGIAAFIWLCWRGLRRAEKRLDRFEQKES